MEFQGTALQPRRGAVRRETRETTVSVTLDLDGRGHWEIGTGVRFFDHLLSQLASHGLFDITISASGVDQHHVVEDVAICCGRALDQALGERRGIARMGHAIIPMDDALALVAVDIGGRGGAAVDISLSGEVVGDMEGDMVRHFLHSLAQEGRMNLHAQVLKGINDHHKVEAVFKALARSLKHATRLEPRREGDFPSTKGIMS